MCYHFMVVRGFSLWATSFLRSSSTNTLPFPNSSNFYVVPMSTSRITYSSTSGLAGKKFVLRAGRLGDKGARATPWVYHLGLKVTSSSFLDYLFTPTRKRLSNGLPITTTVLFATSGELTQICYTDLLSRSRKLSVSSPTTPKLWQTLPLRLPSATLLVSGQKSRGAPTLRRSPRGGSSMRRSLSLMA